MNQRHKHADVIIAWANGAEIEYRNYPTASWVSAGVLNELGWYESWEYRVKPPAKKYRVVLFRDTVSGNIYTSAADTVEDASFCEKDVGFVRWLTDWVEYDE